MSDLKPCGTVAAYMRHRRDGEEPCEACKEAKRLDSKARRGARGHDSLPTHPRRPRPKAAGHDDNSTPPSSTPDVELPATLPDGDALVQLRISRLRGNLGLVDRALLEALPKEVAALSKRRQELEDAIWKAAGKNTQRKDIVDELAKARADRQAKAQARVLPAVRDQRG